MLAETLVKRVEIFTSMCVKFVACRVQNASRLPHKKE